MDWMSSRCFAVTLPEQTCNPKTFFTHLDSSTEAFLTSLAKDSTQAVHASFCATVCSFDAMKTAQKSRGYKRESRGNFKDIGASKIQRAFAAIYAAETVFTNNAHA